jgi:ABC-type uncharacterized transport system involved in gliding motility auxiliary subunit
MNRTTKIILAMVFIAAIAVSAVSIIHQIGKSMRIDITDGKLYTLSDGTKQILSGLKQPITIKLFYSKTASMKAPDQIRFYTNYYTFVRALLEEYANQAGGMVKLEVIDPRPYSEEEMAGIRYNLKQFNISQEEKFFFGLVVQTEFGITKTIDFFSPDRQSFVEYDISSLIDSAMTRQKSKIGILSSLPVMGDDASGYMAYMMRMQGQQPKPAWGIVQQLKEKYEVSAVSTDVNEISDIDMLLVIHPKNLSEKTQFAVDQYVLRGGRAILFVDPHSIADRPDERQMQMGQMPETASGLPNLLKAWGLEMPAMTFAGDRMLAVTGALRRDERPMKILGIMKLSSEGKCFGVDSPATAMLKEINTMFPGVLKKISVDPNGPASKFSYTPLLSTTDKGNTWSVGGIYELMNPDYASFLRNFRDGSEPVAMGYMVSGQFKSAFPNGVTVEEKTEIPDPNKPGEKIETTTQKTLTGLTEAKDKCVVAVFADVDMISDYVAYQQTMFGMAVVGDNSNLLLNMIDQLSGSTALMAVRSRGQYSRPFSKVDQIEADAEAKTADKEAEIMAQIKGFEQELNQKLAALDKKEDEMISKTILAEKRTIELKLREKEKELRDVKMQKVKSIEAMGNKLKSYCTLPGPAIILLIAVVLGLRRSFMRRHYVSHASDA